MKKIINLPDERSERENGTERQDTQRRIRQGQRYAKNRRTEKRSKVKSELWNGLKFVLAAVVGGVIDRLLQIFFGI